MKSLLFLAILMLSFLTSIGQTQVTTFDELMDAFKNGKEVKAVFHYAKCQLISENEIQEKITDAIGGFTLEVYEFFAKGAVYNKEAFVVSSTSKLIKNPIGEGYVYNYAKVKVSESNDVRITATYVDTLTFEEKMNENFFTVIKNSENDGGAVFYISD